MKKITILLTMLLSVFVLAPSVVFAYSGYELSISNAADTIESNQASFTVTITPAIQDGDEVTVDYTTGGGTATAYDDYDIHTNTLLIITGDGTTEVYATVVIKDDSLVESTETFNVTIDNPTNTGGDVSITTSTASCDILDNDTFSISVNNSSANEGNDVTFTITLNTDIAIGVDATYNASDGSATVADNDYTNLPGAVMFSADSLAGDTQTFTVATGDDTKVEGDETFTVTVSSSHSAYDGNDKTGTGTITDNDAATVSIAANDAVAAEPGDDGQFTVTMTNQSSTDTVIGYNVAGDAMAGSDYTALSGSVTISANATTATIDVDVSDDNLVEDNETVTVTLTSITNGDADITIGASNSDTVTIADDDAATVSIAGTTDGDETAPTDGLFTLTQTAESSTDTVLTLTPTGTAINGTDYTALAATVTIPAGDTQATVTIYVTDDGIVEETETVILTIAKSSGDAEVTVGTDNATINILDDDSATFTINDQAVSEAAGTMTLTVSLDNPLDIPVAVDVSYTDVTATGGGTDYDSTTGTVNFAADDTADKTVTVAIANDNIVELSETFTASLSTTTALGGRSTDFSDTGTGTIQNDDAATVSIAANDAAAAEPGDDGQFTVTMTNTSDTDTTVSYTVSGDATSGSDYTALSGSVTISANATTATIDVEVINDNLVEDNETVTVTLTGITSGHAGVTIGAPNSDTVTIADDDSATFTINDQTVSEAAGTMTLTVSLDNPLDIPVAVDVSYTDVTATGGGTDYDSTTDTANFAAGDTANKTVTVAITDDNIVELSETFTASLSTSTALGGRSADFSDTGTGTISVDDQTTITINDITVNENAGTATFTVSFSVVADDDVTVDYATANNTAVAPGDYTATSGTVTISAGNLTGTIDVSIIDDGNVELAETFFVNLSNPSANATIGDPQGECTINVDEQTTLTIDDIAVNENVGTATFTVSLSAVADDDVTVDYATANNTAVAPGDYTATSNTLTINAGSLTGTIDVSIIDDGNVELAETFFVNLSNPSANATIGDSQGECEIGIEEISSITIDDITVNENVGTATFTVSLSVAADDDVTVDYATANGTAVSGSDYTSTSGTLTINAGNLSGSIDVPVTNDAVVEPVETFNIDLTGCSANALITDNQGVGTITDNDYTVIFNTATVGPVGIDGGTVNGVLSLTQEVEHGTDCTPVTANPNAGYRFTGWTGDYTGTNNALTVTNVTSDMTITANFIAIYTITATAGANGTISPSGAVIVDYETDQTFIFDPDTCKEVDDVVVDGSSIGGEIREYTFTNVTANHTIDVQFYHYDCTITATAEYGGTIVPSGAVIVPCGSSQTFSIAAAPGNEIAEVLVDGVDLGFGSGITTYDYNWTNVKKDDDDTSPCVHYIVAKFTRQASSCVEISDTPLAALSRSAPAVIMFLLDDSGSMDWEFMTDEPEGLFNGNYYVFNDPGDNQYPQHILSGDDRLRWKSQWLGYNRMYYDPNVEYKPWPTRPNADSDFPRSHPMYDGNTLDLSGIYESIDDGIVVDNLDGAPDFTTTGTWYESGSTPEYDGSSFYTSNSGDTATFRPTIPAAGFYEVYAFWNCNNNRDENAQITIVDSLGTHTDYWDQREGGENDCGQWVLLGTYNFDAGTSGTVTIARHAASTGNSTVADAVKFVVSGTGLVIKNAHYYVWSTLEAKPYLVIIDDETDPKTIKYYEVNDDGDDFIEANELTLSAPPPSDVVTGRTYTEERQNFANWYSFYRKRELAATAAISNVIVNMQGVQIGLRGINGYDVDIIQPVRDIKVGGVDETDILLDALYNFDLQAWGTPLRRGLEAVGMYFHQDDGQTGGIGDSPYASAADGGECQQVFAVVMTDGYWNGWAPQSNANGNHDGDNNTEWDGPPYGDTYSSTLADVAMYYYENDLSSSLGDLVPVNPWDNATHQHMVTFGVSFGVKGTLNPDDYDFENTFPTWPDPVIGTAEKIDDLWHASFNGRGFFLTASNPNELVNSLLTIMRNIEIRAGSASAVSVNGDQLYTKLTGDRDIFMFQSSYNTDGWTGDVKAYKVCTELTGDCAGKNIGDIIKSPEVWSANEKLETLNWNTARKIVTYNGTDAGTAFRWSGLTTDQKTALNNDSTLLDYLRGDTSNEQASGGSFRDRFARLGDIVHSSPRFENGVLYTGGNDGMLHAFAAADDEPYTGAVGGEELFAYVPNLVFDNLSQLAVPAYTHKYFVDLTPMVKSGVNVGTLATPDLITLLVGGLGKGGRGYYALNVTDPTAWASETAVAGKVMWEYPKAGVTDDDMGYSFSKPALVESRDSSAGSNGWIVIFGNGYNSTNGHAVLYILNPQTGDIIKKIDTGAGGCNGLSTPVPVDVDYDNKVDYVYVGDLRGNVWKFDLTDPNYTNWEVAFSDASVDQPLFQAQGPGGTTQPITTKLDVMYHPREHGYLVVFGTGKYLGESDITDTTIQSFYGIWDYGDDGDDEEYLGSFKRGFSQELSNQPNTVSLLAQEVIPSESPDPNAPDFWTVTINEGQPDEYDLLLRLTTDYKIIWEAVSDRNSTPSVDPLNDLSHVNDNHAGWYFDLPLSGEKATVDIMIRDGNVIAISFAPDDAPCSSGGNSVIHEFDAESGARLTLPQFDINGDGVIDENDMINIGTDEDPIWVVPTGILFPGQLQPPAILIDPESGVEIKYLSSSSGAIVTVKEKPPQLGVCHWREFE